MPQLEISQDFAAPPEAVFDTLTDLANTAEIVQGIDSLELLTEGPVGVGTRFRETRTIFGKQATEEMEVSVFERPGRYVLLAESRGMRYESVHVIEPTEEGCRLTLTFNGEPQTTSAKLMSAMSGVFIGSMKKLMAQDMADLKAAVEGGAGADGAEAAESAEAPAPEAEG